MKYVLKKTASFLVTIFIVSFLVFLAFDLIKGDVATAILQTEATPEKLAALREELGLNDPFFVRYGRWAYDFIRGDFGTSYIYKVSVGSMLADKIPITVCLTLMAFVLMVLISVPLAVYCGKKTGSFVQKAIFTLSQINMAVPPFFMGILLTYVFGLVLHLFSPGGYISYKEDFGGFLLYLICPAVAMALPKSAMSLKLLYGKIVTEAKKDYVRTAYSRGNKTMSVLYRHVLPNALIPCITFWGMTLSDMVVGGIIIEQVFGIPGIGRILINSISNRDYPVVMAIIVFLAALIILLNTLTDILYYVIDPRLRNRS